jgi:hypothetical protein
VCARLYGIDPKIEFCNDDEENLAIDILLRLFNDTMGYKFTREDLLAEVTRRS